MKSNVLFNEGFNMVFSSKHKFECWVETNEHAPGVKVNSRIMNDDFITEYFSSYDGTLLAQAVSSESGELYYIYSDLFKYII